ncbi:DUF58 domain-containing protein [Candidatus Bipolaricaulota bacterium]|nr:DUF58 domain-containing protein [Candidatus Bipolaricaulota bacterium]
MESPKARTEFALLVLLLALGIGFRLPPLAFLALPVAVHLVGGYLFAVGDRRPRFAAHRTLSAIRLWEGETVEVETTLVNRGSRVELVHVTDPLPPGLELTDGATEGVAELGGGDSVSLRYTVRARRGHYPLRSLHVEAEDLLGYATWYDDLPCPTPLTVLPRFERLRGIAIAPRRTLVQAGTARSRRGGVGIEFFGTREYRPGDEIRRINWKAAARVGELVVTEFEEERAADVAVVLDVRERAYRVEHPLDLLDHAVRGAASLCQAFLASGHRVGLLLYGAYVDWVYPGYGRRHGERLLGELARARLGTSEVFAELTRIPTRLLRPGSQVALVSPLLPGDAEDLGTLTARGYRVMVLIPDPTTVPGPSRRDPEVEIARRILQLERQTIVARLHAARARPVVWDVRYPLAPQAKAGWRRVQ